MKPTVELKARSVFEELSANEKERQVQTQKLLKEMQHEALKIEEGTAETFLRRLVHATQTFLVLADSCVFPTDLQPAPVDQVVGSR